MKIERHWRLLLWYIGGWYSLLHWEHVLWQVDDFGNAFIIQREVIRKFNNIECEIGVV